MVKNFYEKYFLPLFLRTLSLLRGNLIFTPVMTRNSNLINNNIMTNNYNKKWPARLAIVGWLRLLILFVGLGVGVNPLFAQTTVTIGTGTLTASGTNGTPIYRSASTSSFHHSKSIQLLTATDLSAAGVPSGAVITAWGYNKTTAATISGTNSWTINVYLKNSSATALVSGTAWSTMISTATLVYSNTMTAANFPATAGYWLWPVSGFVYTGGSVECYVEWFPAGTMTSPFTSAAFPWQYTTTVGAQAMGTSNSVAIPGTNTAWTTQARFYNTQITYSPGASNDLGLQATAVPSGNNSICNGASQNVSVTLRNNGSAAVDFSVDPVTINSSVGGPNPASFTPVVINSGTLAAGATQVVTLATGYNASLAGTYGFTASLSWGPDGFPGNNTYNWTATSAFSVTASSNVYTFCDGTLPQLTTAASSDYVVTSIPFAPDASTLTQSVGALGDEGNQTVNLPFNFTFNGTSYNAVTIHANGQILMGANNTTADFQYSPPNIFTNTAPNNWVGFWSDLNVTTAGSITYDIIGVAPSRKLVVRFTNVNFYSATPFVTYQIELNETSNVVDVFLTSVNGVTNTKAIGLETNTAGVTPPGRNSGTWTATNEGWRFAQPTLTYTWTPATGLSNPNIANPVATLAPGTSQTYTVSVYNPILGCTVNDTVLLTNLGAGDPAPSTVGASVCAGVPATLTASGVSTLRWYTSQIGGTLVNTGTSYTNTFASTTTLWVESFNGTCPSARTPVTVTVTPQPVVGPSATPSALCLGASSQLAANNYVSGNLVTTTAAGNGASGNVFTISNVNGTSPIRIDSVYMGITAGTLAEVWYLPSAYTCGTSPTSAGWTQVGQVAITPAGAAPALTSIPLFINVTIPVGQTYSFAVSCNGSNYYTNGTTECAVAAADANISIAQGRGGAITAGTFSFPNTPRIWNGRVYYSFGDPNLTFNWTQTVGSGSISNSAIANPVVTPSTSGTNTYSVLATNLAGCTTVASVNVTANPIPVDAVIDSVTNVFCGCGTANIYGTTVSSGTVIRWYDAPTGGTLLGTTASNAAFATPYACGPVTYYAEAVNTTTGCVQSGPRASVTVTPTVAPSVSASATATLLCDGTPTSSTITASSANDPNYTYTWAPSTFLNTASGATVVSTPTSSTTYTVTGTDGSTGCVAQAVVTINVGTTPTITGVTATPASICLGNSSQLSATALAGGTFGAEPTGYCTAVVPTSPGQSGDFISNVTFNTLNNTSGDDVDDYEYFTPAGATTTTVSAGSTYALTVTTDPAFGQGKGVFIDWNRDGIFDASEAVMLSASGTTPVTVNVTVPLSASQGYTRMRVVCWYANTATLAIACSTTGSIGFGETEDYTITVLSGGALNYAWSPSGSLSNASIANPVATPASTVNYNVTVTDAAGCATSSSVPVTVVNPPAAPSVTNASVCGQGVANLSAAGSGGTLIWLDTLGGPILATGNNYSPYVYSTQTYYVVEDQGATVQSVGLSATAAGTTAYASSTGNFQTFNVLNPGGIIIRTVDIVPNAATPLGTAVAIQLEDAAGNALGAPVSTVTTTQGTPQTITLDMYVPQGTGYRLRPVNNPNLQYHQNGFTNPYTLPGLVSITGWGPPNATTLYVFFYNWSVSAFNGTAGCFSAPSIATATVTPAPALNITPSGPTSWCNTGSVDLDAATSSDPSWTSFSWSPATGLNTASGPLVTASPSVTTTYVVTATGGGCIDTASVTVTVNSGPTVSIAPAPFDSLCNGSSFTINAASGSSSVKSIGTGTNSANNTIAVYDGFNTGVKTQILYTAAELNAAGLYGPGNITSIAFNVVNKLSTGVLNGFSISMANVAATSLTTTYATGTFTNVFTGNVSTVLGWNTHTFTTPFLWDGTSNVLVEVCNGTPTVSAFDQIQNTPTAATMTIQANLLGCASATGNAILNRPNVRFTGGVVNYSWSPAGELSASNIEDPVYTAATTGSKSLTLTVTDPANGCVASATLNFVVSDVPKVATVAAISSTSVCYTGTVSMRAFGTGASLQWQSSADGVSFTDLSGETNDTLTQTVSTDTWYRVKSICVDSSFSSSLFFDVSAPAITSTVNDTVCGQGAADLVANPAAGDFVAWFDSPTSNDVLHNGSTYTTFVAATDTFWVAPTSAQLPVGSLVPTGYPANSATVTGDEDIVAVTIGSLVNNQPAPNCALYTDYTNLPAPALALGSSVPFSISIGDCENAGFFSSGAAMFVDFNRDGDFADAGEGVFATTAVTNGLYTVSGNFTVPLTASAGYTRVRIINAEGFATPTYNQSYSYGETEDYLVYLGDPVCVGTRVPVIAVVSPAPPIAVTPSSATVCGGGSVNLDVTTGLADYTTFTWTPAFGLNVTSGPSVVASPSVSTSYLVTASGNLFGCEATATASVSVNPLPVIDVTTANSNLCNGDTAFISLALTSPDTVNYTAAAITYSPVVPTGTPVVLCDAGVAVTAQTIASLDDGTWEGLALPSGFAFNYFGTTPTQFNVSTNGFITFGATLGSAYCCSGQLFPNTGTPNDYIALAHEDLLLTASGKIDYFTEGTAPFRKFVIRFTNVPVFGGGGTVVDGEIVLNETANTIEYHVGTAEFFAGNNMTMGIENSTGSLYTVINGRNSTSPVTVSNEGWLISPPAPVAISWTGQNIVSGAGTASIAAVPSVSGYYVATVTNTATGCSTSDSVQITFAVSPKPVIATNDTSLCAPNVIDVVVVDTGIYAGGYPAGTTFEWFGLAGQIVPATPDLDTIPSSFGSSYYVHVTLVNGCNALSDTAYILTKAVAIVDTIVNAACGSLGSIEANVTSGIAPYNYVWSTDLAQTNVIQNTVTSSTVDVLSNLPAGTYYLSVADEYGLPTSCSSGVIAYVVGGANPIVVDSISQTNVVCNGQTDGTATVYYSGGVAPISILWSTGSTASSIAGLAAGTYSVIVSDFSGCADTAYVTITEPAALSAVMSSTPESASGAADGTATALVSGGTPGYTIDWYDLVPNYIVTGPTATGLTAGFYQILVQDANFCQYFDTVEVTLGGGNVNLNLTMLIEGMYDGVSGLVPALLNSGVGLSATECDTIHVELRDQTSPTTVLASGDAVLNTNGQASFTFPGAVNGATGYIAVFHRNAVETWSDLVTFSGTTSYDFTTASTQAYAGNQKEVATGVWAFFSGDLSPQDGLIDVTDQGLIDNDIFNFVSGYAVTDITGDGLVDVTDQGIVDNNIFNFVGSLHP